MTIQSQPHDIVVRKIPFEFDEGIEPIWHKQQPEWSHMLNGASMTMPYLEPFLIRSVREAMSQIDDPALLEDARAFNAQEGQHYQNHRRFNDLLKASGYPELAQIEDEMEADYARIQKKSLRWRLAYTAGFETMTMGITEWLIRNRSELFSGADPRVVSFVLWHMVEETEHKTVAFDVYQHLYKSYWARVWGIVFGSMHVLKFSRKSYVLMLKKDGYWRSWRSRLTTFKRASNFMWHVGKMLLLSMMPGHHPDRVSDPKWVADWMHAFQDLPADRIPLLDTSDPNIPAQFT